MTHAQQLAEKEYEFVNGYYTDSPSDQITSIQRAAFINGYNSRHQWQRVEPDWQPEEGTYWYAYDGSVIHERAYKFIHYWFEGMKRIDTPTHVMPYFFPELPINQTTHP